jgi:hypothetical protein
MTVLACMLTAAGMGCWAAGSRLTEKHSGARLAWDVAGYGLVMASETILGLWPGAGPQDPGSRYATAGSSRFRRTGDAPHIRLAGAAP